MRKAVRNESQGPAIAGSYPMLRREASKGFVMARRVALFTLLPWQAKKAKKLGGICRLLEILHLPQRAEGLNRSSIQDSKPM
jgi:hypothetical protein